MVMRPETKSASGQAGEPDPSSMLAVWLCPEESIHSTLTVSLGEYFTSAWVSSWAEVMVEPSDRVATEEDEPIGPEERRPSRDRKSGSAATKGFRLSRWSRTLG